LRREVNVPLGEVIVNRVLPELFTRDEQAVFDRLRQPAALAALSERAGADTERVLDAAALAVALRRERAANLVDLQDGLPPSMPTLLVPELFARSQGKRAVMQVADALGEELA
jgi:hypothetical protein